MAKWMLKILLLVMVGTLIRPLSARAQHSVSGNNIEVSLLTCGPGSDIYELYGHTALRVRHLGDDNGWVFNYGVFDFDAPNFVWRFIKGQTDYMLGVCDYATFLQTYDRLGRYVDEQVLNLQSQEKERLYAALVENWSQEGWTYRYNFLSDNCTTRAVNMVVQVIDGKVVWPKIDDQTPSTLREVVHECSATQSPWGCFAQDLMLGSEVDERAGVAQLMFSPLYAEQFLDKAVVTDEEGKNERPLVAKKQRVLTPQHPVQHKPFPITPMAAMLMLLAVAMLVGGYERRKHRVVYGFDYVLMAIMGLAGCVIAMLFFASEHPAVDSNWLIVLLNPLPLLLLPLKVWQDKRGTGRLIHVVLLLQVVAFVLIALLRVQQFPGEIYVLALILLLRWWSYRQQRNGVSEKRMNEQEVNV